jgi:adenylosuccinate synthase
MTVSVVIGLQWGDEGKGKLVDFIGEQADIACRFQGGNNAGHTVIVENQKIVLHLLPSAVLHKNTQCILGPGVVVDPIVLCKELDNLEKHGFPTDHIFISDRAHLVLPYHIVLEGQPISSLVGTTKRGIGFAYADVYQRKGIRMADFIRPDTFATKYIDQINAQKNVLDQLDPHFTSQVTQQLEALQAIAARLKHRVIDSLSVLRTAIQSNQNILLEGAQAAMLDIHYGTYPYVTSSSPTSGGATVGLGIPPQCIHTVHGVFKAYSTRVGNGPFITELHDETGKWIGKQGHEFGSTTGRPRRCGWLDLPVLKHACWLSGVNHGTMTKLDVLSGLEKIAVCTGYMFQGNHIDTIPAFVEDYAAYEPIYTYFDGWQEDLRSCRTLESLPKNARFFVEYIQKALGIPLFMVSVGPERNENILL